VLKLVMLLSKVAFHLVLTIMRCEMKLLKKLKGILLKKKAVLLSFGSLALLTLLAPALGYAAAGDVTQGLSMGSISHNVNSSMQSISTIIHAISILGGIAFFVAFAFKAKQHRDNPTQVTIGQPLMYLFLAIILTALPWFISSSKQMVYGSTAKVSNWDGSQMNQLFGSAVQGN
jgi:intracellular multiplication protein IcmD